MSHFQKNEIIELDPEKLNSEKNFHYWEPKSWWPKDERKCWTSSFLLIALFFIRDSALSSFSLTYHFWVCSGVKILINFFLQIISSSEKIKLKNIIYNSCDIILMAHCGLSEIFFNIPFCLFSFGFWFKEFVETWFVYYRIYLF